MKAEELIKKYYPFYDRDKLYGDVSLDGEQVIALMEEYAQLSQQAPEPVEEGGKYADFVRWLLAGYKKFAYGWVDTFKYSLPEKDDIKTTEELYQIFKSSRR